MTETADDQARNILIAVDGSKHSERAFKCKKFRHKCASFAHFA